MRCKVLVLVAWLMLAMGSGMAGEVQVRVATVRDARGTVRAELCGRGEWLGEGCLHKSVAAAVVGVTVVTFTHVPAGVWAVVAFHDRNNDGEVDRNVLGIPIEGVGFSRDPSLGLRGPRFEDCALTVSDEGAVVSIRLRFE